MLLKRNRLAFLIACLALGPLPLLAAVSKAPQGPLDAATFSRPELHVSAEMVTDTAAIPARLQVARTAFASAEGGQWRIVYDRLTGSPALLEGGLVPILPGAGNQLRAEDIGLPAGTRHTAIPVSLVERRMRELMVKHPELFVARPDELVLRPAASGPVLQHVYYVDFQWTHGGVPVRGARVVFRINSGNLVQIGSELVSRSIDALDPRPSIDPKSAIEILRASLPGGASPDQYLAARLEIEPVAAGPVQAEGRGIGYRLAWVLTFRRPGVMGTWQGKVDAHSGEVLSFLDTNRYGKIEGGVYVADQPSTEANHPLAYMDYGVGLFADAAGNFPGTTGTSTMDGQYVNIGDQCGAISLTADTSGEIDFGTSSGTDCTTPGVGGAGNTHSARTQAYNITGIKRNGLDYMPTNSWLAQSLTANVNITSTCNAYWDGTSVNFFRSGGGCGNTGELPGVSLHEYGHGIDDNDGIPIFSIPAAGSTEGYADVSAVVFLHDSCLGGGFFIGQQCSGYGDPCTNCTGIRDADWAMHQSGVPHTPVNFVGPRCGSGGGYDGPCGGEGHCEGYIQAESLFDLATRDLITWGMDQPSAWLLTEKLWWATRPTATDPYVCPTINTSHGCGAGTMDTIFRTVDDCDGNLTNGTPHATAIFAALNRHIVGCTTAANVDNACGCATLVAPVVTGTPGVGVNDLSWPAVPGATAYNVYRNDVGCDASFTLLAQVTGTTYQDVVAAVGISYSYRVQALGAAGCPGSPLSNCVSMTTQCAAAPTTLTAVASAQNQITLTWVAGVPPSPTYNVYRSLGACPGSGMAILASGVTGTTYVDNNVSGTITYSYEVTAGGGTCESAPSNCADATATGPCNGAPVFGGITSAEDAGLATCTIDLGWSAGTAICGGTVSYNVYRDVVNPFTPASTNRIATGVATTTYQDANGLVSGTTYYYIVRAVDNGNNAEDTNLVTLGAVPQGPPVVAFSDDGGDTGTAQMIATSPWSLAPTGGNNGPAVYQTGFYPDNICAALTTPSFGVTLGTTVSFATHHDIETDWDRGEVQISTDGGASWARVDVGYPLVCNETNDACPLPPGVSYFSGLDPTYDTYSGSLDPWAGTTAVLRFEFSTDTSVNGAGWWIDDIVIQQRTPCNTQTQAPIADFTGTPLAGQAPLSVTFSDASSGAPTSWSWDFGDGGTSTVQNPVHVYVAPGSYDVTLVATNAAGSDTETKVGYITVTAGISDEVVTGAGPGSPNAPVVKTWDHAAVPAAVSTWAAYGAGGFGVNVGSAQITGSAMPEVLTGPGPSASYGPQVRAFTATGTAIAKVNFFAYGTLRYGAHATGGDVDRDGWSEILTSPGPGDVFGPHIRGFAYDGSGPLAAISKISFFAYSTLKYGARVAGGDVDGDGFSEIITGAGAGQVFAPHVRTFNYDDVQVTAKASFFAFPAGRYGACVGSGDTDADGTTEVYAAHGPDPTANAEARGFDVSSGVQNEWIVTTFASGSRGAEVAGGDVDTDGKSELVAGRGWGGADPSTVVVYAINGSSGTQVVAFEAYATQSYGTKVSAGDIGI